MTETRFAIEVREQHFQPVMSVRTISSVTKLPQLIGETYERIMLFLKEMDVNPAGPPFVSYVPEQCNDEKLKKSVESQRFSALFS